MAQEKPTAKPSKTLRMQSMLLGAVVLIFLIWAARKCSGSQAEAEAVRQEQNEVDKLRDSMRRAQEEAVAAAAAAAQQANRPAPAPRRPSDGVQRDTLRGGQIEIIRERIVPLYVTIQGLALRKGPGVNNEIIDRLDLYQELRFMNETTDSLYTIKLGSITTVEPWVKVKSAKGREGWVYGAGVDFYKRKLEGVE